MTVKQFFKGTAFKCIIVLMSVLLISGVLLAICWGFLEVTDDERFNRKIGAVYGGEEVTAIEQDISEKNTSVSGATIQKVWFIEEKKDYLVQASSRGYNGDVICWITVNMKSETEVKGLGKVILYGVGDPAELTGNIPGSVYEKFPAEYTDDKKFTYGTEIIDSGKNPEYIKTKASSTMSAICNDVNGAVAFVKAYAAGEDTKKDYSLYINQNDTTWQINGTAVEYTIITKTQSSGGLTYSPFKIVLTVDKVNGKATTTDYKIVENGSSPIFPGNDTDYKTLMSEIAKNLSGKTLADIESYIALNDGTKDDVINTGATNSNLTCYEAVAYALSKYEEIIDTEGGNN